MNELTLREYYESLVIDNEKIENYYYKKIKSRMDRGLKFMKIKIDSYRITTDCIDYSDDDYISIGSYFYLKNSLYDSSEYDHVEILIEYIKNQDLDIDLKFVNKKNNTKTYLIISW
ncbi:hypothetical protein QLL95_gp0080 [Cotonvirus japonicus]|uniref:Ankyrin repeat protein n=1 Tax=Cotonvirus japonicus TaxID=2811091 RepID=A0ABM7NQY0_9VIRU|nr:hypothetical protein QLL95_gp0080 [Cotonvirus japonicus]BCS82569.1 hypothetical protein [Cotonvirus japonicus]